MSVGREPLSGHGHAHQVEHSYRTVQALLLAHLAVDLYGLGDLVPDRHRRVERSHGILEDHRQLVALM